MANDWRDRLLAEIEKQGKSLREVSLAAGLGETYLSDNFRREKEPGASTLEAVCAALGVSYMYIRFGLVISPEAEKTALAVASAPDEKREKFVRRSLEAKQGAGSRPQPGSAPRKPKGGRASAPRGSDH